MFRLHQKSSTVNCPGEPTTNFSPQNLSIVSVCAVQKWVRIRFSATILLGSAAVVQFKVRATAGTERDVRSQVERPNGNLLYNYELFISHGSQADVLKYEPCHGSQGWLTKGAKMSPKNLQKVSKMPNFFGGVSELRGSVYKTNARPQTIYSWSDTSSSLCRQNDLVEWAIAAHGMYESHQA
jgi:hypothetical protein